MSPTLHAKAPMWSLLHLPSISFPNDSLVHLQSWRIHCKLNSGLGFIYNLTHTLNSNRGVVMTLQVSRYHHQLWTHAQRLWKCLCIPLCLVYTYPRKWHASLRGALGVSLPCRLTVVLQDHSSWEHGLLFNHWVLGPKTGSGLETAQRGTALSFPFIHPWFLLMNQEVVWLAICLFCPQGCCVL